MPKVQQRSIAESVLHSHGGGAGLLLLVPLCPPLLTGSGVSRADVLEVGVLSAVVLGAGVLGAGVFRARVLGEGGCGVVVCGGKGGEITHRSMAGSGVHPPHVLADVVVDLPVVEPQELDGEVGLALGHLLPTSWVLACPYHWSHD